MIAQSLHYFVIVSSELFPSKLSVIQKKTWLNVEVYRVKYLEFFSFGTAL